MLGYQVNLGLSLCIASTAVAAVKYPVPSNIPPTAVELDPTPLGVSFEFFMWPSYMTNITPPLQCIDHFSQLYGKKMPIRIGGTTQDRATYDPDFDGYVSYHVDDPLDAPMNLTYGPKFFDFISEFGAETVLGFNRGDNNLTNTLEATLMAKSKVLDYLWGIELGNEPDIYLSIWQKPVAVAPWNSTLEGNNAAEWAQAFIEAWEKPLPILVAGVYAGPMQIYQDYPSTDYLIEEAYNETVKAGTRTYNTHLYSLPDSLESWNKTVVLSDEMNHVKTVSDLSYFTEKIETAKSVNRSYIIGETGFHADDTTMDATFGGALQVLDKALWALSLGIERLYYHQGTINQDNQVNAPFYGGYMAALAFDGGDHVVASDPGNNSYAQYVTYKEGAPYKVLLINTDYYSGVGHRNSTSFTLTGLTGKKVEALRLTAPSSEVVTSLEQEDPECGVTIGGQYFSHRDCEILGKKHLEHAKVSHGTVTFLLAASEALLVYL